MKVFVLVFVLNAIYLFSLYDVTAQLLEQPTINFEKFEFDRGVVRGGFNLSSCLIEYFTCLETVKPDVVCMHWKTFESVCTVMQQACDEETGMQNLKWDRQALFEITCRQYNSYT